MRPRGLEPGTFEAVRAYLRATPQGRRLHRIHAVLLVAGGLSCRRAARLLGDSPRSVEYWVSRFRIEKMNGMREKKKSGRPPILSPQQRAQARVAVSGPPPASWGGRMGWNGPALRAYLQRRCGVTLGLRQAQRLLAELRAEREKK